MYMITINSNRKIETKCFRELDVETEKAFIEYKTKSIDLNGIKCKIPVVKSVTAYTDSYEMLQIWKQQIELILDEANQLIMHDLLNV